MVLFVILIFFPSACALLHAHTEMLRNTVIVLALVCATSMPADACPYGLPFNGCGDMLPKHAIVPNTKGPQQPYECTSTGCLVRNQTALKHAAFYQVQKDNRAFSVQVNSRHFSAISGATLEGKLVKTA